MTVIIEINPQNQKALEAAFGPDLRRAALESMAIEGYRSGRLTRFQVQNLLTLASRWTTEAWLKQHQAFPPLTLEDVQRDVENSQAAREA